MNQIFELRPKTLHYAWGSRSALAAFLGREPAGEPEAELWMGAHPKAPSEIEVGGRWTSLAEVVSEHAEEVLGQAVVRRFGPAVPFLFKVLAAERALSIQAHPDRLQAVAGCRREDALGLPRDDPRRNYRDASPKPEILYAVERFDVLRGFRPAAESYELLRIAGLPDLLPEACGALRDGDLERFFALYMSLDEERLAGVLPAVLGRLQPRVAEDDGFAWVLELARQFPGDRGVLAPLYLHLLTLEPGDALVTGPGVLHAYLSGVGIELMASSDNVVRGGLTAKHVDVAELLDIVRFEPQPPRLAASTAADGVRRFETGTDEIELAVIEVTPATAHESRRDRGVEILLAGAGEGRILDGSGTAGLAFSRGDALLVPAAVPVYRVEGSATLFRAGVGSR